jgi:hypothetical protein
MMNQRLFALHSAECFDSEIIERISIKLLPDVNINIITLRSQGWTYDSHCHLGCRAS